MAEPGRRTPAAGRWAINAALVAGSVAACLGLFEIGVRLLGPERGDWYASGPGRVAFLADHVRRNADGFRDRAFTPEPAPGVVRILALGDSFTFGDGIADVDATWPRVLERALRDAGRPAEVYNLGIPGTNTASHRRVFETKGRGLHPRIVVLGFVLNDPEPPGANRADVPARLNPPLVPWRGLDTFLSRRSYAWAWARAKRNQIQERFGWKETYTDYVRSLYRPGPAWEAFRAEAGALVHAIHAEGATITVALFPMFHDLEHDPFAAELDAAASVFREAGADDIVDLRQAYAATPTSALWVAPTDAHPNARAHRIAGEAVAARLRQGLN